MSEVNGNLPPVEAGNSTTKYFNNFFTTGVTVNQNVNDAVIGYFQTVTGNKESGRLLASTVLYTALNQGLDPMLLVDEFKTLNGNELNAYLTMFLNTNRVSTSLLGITNAPQTSKYVTRTILA